MSSGATSDPEVRPTRVTLEMVAARAGVSRGTAGRVLSGSPNVSALASRSVRDAAAELGYRPNLAARSLVTGRTGLVGLAVNVSDDHLFSDPFFAKTMRGVHDELADSDHALVLTLLTDDRERDRLLDLAATRLDGLVLVYGHGDPTLAAELARAGAQVVFAGRTPASGPADTTTWVDSDSVSGARQAVEHLVARGRRRIATIAGPQDMAAGLDRLAGWRTALEHAGLPHGPELQAVGDFREATGAQGMLRLLESAPDLDAVFAANDLMAFGALRALGGTGRRVPDDVAVVGFDDIPGAAEAAPGLTTVHQEIEEMGRRMARLLLDRLAGAREHVQEVLPTRLVVRGSS